jgi:hypothetical protein
MCTQIHYCVHLFSQFIADHVGRTVERVVYTRVFCVRYPVRDGAAAQQLPLLFTYVIAREKQRKLVGSGAITDGETDAKNASVDGP